MDVAGTLIVVAHRDGFRRAGRAWPARPVTVAAGTLTPEQIEQLVAEPMLTVTFEPAPNTERPREVVDGGDASRPEPSAGAGAVDGEPGTQGDDPPPGPAPRGGEPLTIEAACARLDRADASLWTRAGVPTTAALEALLGRDVSAAERDAAWAAVQGASAE